MKSGVFAAILVFGLSTVASAQWINIKTPGTPRKPDGTADLSAPAPKTHDGKPDIRGVWKPSPPYIGNLASDFKPGDAPFQPWAAALFKHRRDTESREDPTGNCIPGGVPRSDAVPYPFKIVYGDKMVVIMYEAVHSYRQIFTDGRLLPVDPNPSWNGYSSGKWEGDTLVVQTSGFRDGIWLDATGNPMTDAAKITERFRRLNFGQMDIEITVDDPKAYTKPWTITLHQEIKLDTDLLDFICSENEKDASHLSSK